MKTQQKDLVGSPHNTTDTTNGQMARQLVAANKWASSCQSQRDELLVALKGLVYSRLGNDEDARKWSKHYRNNTEVDKNLLLAVDAIAKTEECASHLSNSESTTAQQ